MFIILIPIVYSLYGGETWSYHFPKCNILEISVYGTLPIDNDEYNILNDCIKLGDNHWGCDCYDNYDLSISFKTNAVNNYTFYFNYYYSVFEQESSGGSSGSSSGSSGTFTIRFQTNQSRILMLTKNLIARFWVNGIQHTIRLVGISNDSITLEIMSEPVYITLQQDESKQIMVDNETLKMTLKDVRVNSAFVEFEKVEKAKSIISPISKEPYNLTINEGNITEDNETESITGELYNKTIEGNATEEEIIKEPPNLIGIIITISIVLMGIIIYGIYWFRYKPDNYEEYKNRRRD